MFTDWEVLLIVFGIGIGWALTNVLNRIALLVRTYLIVPPKPLRLVKDVRRFETSKPVAIEPPHRLGMWQTRTWAIIFQGEQCRKPLSAREMKARTGLTRPKQWEYLSVLQDGGVIVVVPNSGVVWLMSKVNRRRALITLPYHHDFDPPQFSTLATETVETVRNGTVLAKR